MNTTTYYVAKVDQINNAKDYDVARLLRECRAMAEHMTTAVVAANGAGITTGVAGAVNDAAAEAGFVMAEVLALLDVELYLDDDGLVELANGVRGALDGMIASIPVAAGE